MYTQRRRVIDVLKFKPVDRIPLIEGGIREATMQAWVEQGYPENVRPELFFDLDCAFLSVPIQLDLVPHFEEQTLEQDENYKIWRDIDGAIRKDFINNLNPGFVTRSYLRFPVENRKDFMEIKKRYDTSTNSRYPDNWIKRSRVLNECDLPVQLDISFFFHMTRTWMGFENFCVAFYDQPELLEEIFEFLSDFYIDTLKRGIKDIKIDLVKLSEDMAYKHASMISPEMFRKFLAPHYKRVIRFLKENGVELVFVDSDGYIGELIPEWIETGVDGTYPVEIAANNDLIKLREQFPDFFLIGGIDKRELAKEKIDVYNEVMSKVPFMIEKGGYIPRVDHAVPHNVSLSNFLYYRRLLAQIASGIT